MISILLRFSYLVYLWLHDVLEHENFYDGFQHHVDGVFVQSDFHRGTLPTFLQEKTIVLPHGLDYLIPWIIYTGSSLWTYMWCIGSLWN